MTFKPTIEQCQGNSKLIDSFLTLTLPADTVTPVSLALAFEDKEYCCLFESVEKGANRSRYSFLVMDPTAIWKCVEGKTYVSSFNDGTYDFNSDNIESVIESFRAFCTRANRDLPDYLPPMSYGTFGFMGYDMIRYMEDIPDSNEDHIGLDESIFFHPQTVIIFDSVKDEFMIVTPFSAYSDKGTDIEQLYNGAKEHIEACVKIIKDGSDSSKLNFDAVKAKPADEALAFESNMTREQYHKMVEQAKEYIRAGDIFQVVPSQRFVTNFDKSPLALYRSLRRLNPSPFSFYMKLGNAALVGSSPEVLVRVKNGTVTVRPIAGTRRRGVDEKEDRSLAEDLLADKKELAEHLMLIDLGRNDVGRIAKAGSVKVTEYMVVEHYSHVMHIVSNVTGQLRDECDAIDAFVAGFPVGTVSGAPKIRAMEIIDELESSRRSFYAGGVGYVSSNGDMDTCITLRTGLVKDGKLYVQAGGGVVADSDAEFEYQESCNKAMAIIKASQIQ